MLELAIMPKLKDYRETYIRANGYLAKDCLDFAENLYQNILTCNAKGLIIEPEILSDVFHNLGMLAEQRGNEDLAIANYEQSLNINHSRSMTWLFLAKLYLSRFEKSQTESDYEAGKKALYNTEVLNAAIPVISILKSQYMIA